MTKTFADIIDGIRKAVLGVEVREDIAQGMEYVEQFATTATQKAKEAASSAEKAAQAKQDTEEAKDTAVSAINTAKSGALTAIGKEKETGLNALDEKQQAALDSVAEAVSTAQSAASTATEQATAAASSASAAKTSESNAKTSETESAKNLQGTKEYFEQVRTITIGAQGWYATPEALMAAVPIGENGWWAVVGTTDTIWTWDSDTGAWVNTQAKVDLSDFYTQAQVDALLAGYMPLRAATTTVLGGIKVGDNLSIDADGKLNGAAPYALTAAKVTAALGFTPTRIISSTDAPPGDVSAYPDGTLWITYSTSTAATSADEAVDDTDIHIPDDETVADDSAATPEDTVQDETDTAETTVISDDAEPEEG